MSAETMDTLAHQASEQAPTGGGAGGFLARLPLSVKLWLAGYAVLFVLYLPVLHWPGKLGWHVMEPGAWVGAAFPPTVTADTDLETMAAYAASADYRDAALVRAWEEIIFESHGGVRHAVGRGHRLTPYEAGALAKTILAQAETPGETPREIDELVLYRETALAQLPWPYVMQVYNLLGLFLLLRAFAWGPIRVVLDGKAAVTRQQLATARAAREETERLRARREEILREVAAERARLQETAATEFAQERARILEAAKAEAEGMIASLRAGLRADVDHAAAGLRRRVVREAVAEARVILEREATAEDHEDAVRTFLRDIESREIR